jgi:hypothetical protein
MGQIKQLRSPTTQARRNPASLTLVVRYRISPARHTILLCGVHNDAMFTATGYHPWPS